MRIKAILSGRSARPSSRLLAVMLAGVSVLPVACAQAALTDRTQLAVDLNSPGDNHVVRFHAAPNGDVNADGDHNLHFSDELHEHEDELHEHHDVEGRMVFQTEDGRTIIFDEVEPGEDGNLELAFGGDDQNVMIIPEGAEGEFIFYAEGESEAREIAFTDNAGNTVRLSVDAETEWRTEDGNFLVLELPETPSAPERVEPTAEPAPRADVSPPSPTASPAPAAEPAAGSEPKPADAPRALRRVEPPAAPAFSHPVTAGRVTSHFGNRPSRPAGAEADHGGIDIAAPSGTPILAAAGGTVRHAEAGYNGWPAWGNTVVIDHGNGWETLYAHMQDIEVDAGATVAAGEEIGTVGSTGRSTGPHLHLEVRHNGQRVDPAAHVTGLR